MMLPSDSRPDIDFQHPTAPWPKYPCGIGPRKRVVHCATCDEAPDVYAERNRLRGAVDEHHRDFAAIDAVLKSVAPGSTYGELMDALVAIRAVVRPSGGAGMTIERTDDGAD